MRHPIASVCLIVQSDYQRDPRVRRKAEALVAAGYSVDVLALRPADGGGPYSGGGVHVGRIGVGRRRGARALHTPQTTASSGGGGFRAPRQRRTRHYAVIDVNTRSPHRGGSASAG